MYVPQLELEGEDNPHILDLVITNEDFLDIKNTSPLSSINQL